jgi:predicted glycoside hydrolase/deacetylase ChbG (UPF0249 family)
MRIIINADDFGMNPSVNEAVLDLLARNRISSVSMLANASSVEDAARRIPAGLNCSFGVHLNLTQFAPLTRVSERGPLANCLDEKGCFAGADIFRAAKITGPLREAMFKELCLQVERILSLGVEVSHFDSHHHIHTIPGLFPVLKRVQKHFRIRKVRNTLNLYHPGSVGALHLLKKAIWSFALRQYYRTVTTSGFASFAVFFDTAKTNVLSHDSIELMVHPGHPEFEQETRLLYSDWQEEILFATELINYRDL